MPEDLPKRKTDAGGAIDMNMLIRQEIPEDFESVYRLVEVAFRDMPFATHHEQDLVVRLRKSEAFVPELSLVAVADRKIVGHILFTKIAIKAEEKMHVSLMLAPLSVLPEMQGKGIGSRLILEGHGIARALGFASVILVGHPQYYPRFGYLRAGGFGIRLPINVPEEAFMARELAEKALADVRGMVEFPGEFFPES